MSRGTPSHEATPQASRRSQAFPVPSLPFIYFSFLLFPCLTLQSFPRLRVNTFPFNVSLPLLQFPWLCLSISSFSSLLRVNPFQPLYFFFPFSFSNFLSLHSLSSALSPSFLPSLWHFLVCYISFKIWCILQWSRMNVFTWGDKWVHSHLLWQLKRSTFLFHLLFLSRFLPSLLCWHQLNRWRLSSQRVKIVLLFISSLKDEYENVAHVTWEQSAPLLRGEECGWCWFW